jgi:hypothetical protein
MIAAKIELVDRREIWEAELVGFAAWWDEAKRGRYMVFETQFPSQHWMEGASGWDEEQEVSKVRQALAGGYLDMEDWGSGERPALKAEAGE